ncbi:MAG: chromophore lyase CpcT/CpeT [Elainella sp. C42_A2020_010]|nr:chromophore lyase CpcT/CpeT [Elainella sp. C42_A2020_010]
MTVDLTQLAHWLAGEFDNQPQAQDQPVWFVSLRLWQRPLPFRIQGRLALFCEQANSLYLDAPYRQRILVLQPSDNLQQGRAQYLAFKQPERFKGAGAQPERLQTLTLDDLEALPGCELTITYTNQRFKADPDPDVKCCFQYNGQTRQVILGFEATATQFLSWDRGVDPDSGKLLWGALMGAYQFHKRQDFAAELPVAT